MLDIIHSTPAAELSREEETKLVDRVRAGDQTACASLVAMFGPRMMAVARRIMRCDDDCDDALQDAFISAFNALAHFEAESRLSTWLHRITVNSCLMKLRSDSSRNETSIEELLPTLNRLGYPLRAPGDIDDPSKKVEVNETRAFVRRAIDHLPDRDRAVLVLRDIEEMDTAATAALLETSEHNVKRRLRRARETLGVRLEPVMAGKRVCSVAS